MSWLSQIFNSPVVICITTYYTIVAYLSSGILPLTVTTSGLDQCRFFGFKSGFAVEPRYGGSSSRTEARISLVRIEIFSQLCADRRSLFFNCSGLSANLTNTAQDIDEISCVQDGSVSEIYYRDPNEPLRRFTTFFECDDLCAIEVPEDITVINTVTVNFRCEIMFWRNGTDRVLVEPGNEIAVGIVQIEDIFCIEDGRSTQTYSVAVDNSGQTFCGIDPIPSTAILRGEEICYNLDNNATQFVQSVEFEDYFVFFLFGVGIFFLVGLYDLYRTWHRSGRREGLNRLKYYSLAMDIFTIAWLIYAILLLNQAGEEFDEIAPVLLFTFLEVVALTVSVLLLVLYNCFTPSETSSETSKHYIVSMERLH